MVNSGRAALLHGWKPTAAALQVICASIHPQPRAGVHICCGSTRHHCGLAIHLCFLLCNKRSQGIIPLQASDVLQWRSSMRNINTQDPIAKPRITCGTLKKAATIHSDFSACHCTEHYQCLCRVGPFFPTREDVFWVVSAGDK